MEPTIIAVTAVVGVITAGFRTLRYRWKLKADTERYRMGIDAVRSELKRGSPNPSLMAAVVVGTALVHPVPSENTLEPQSTASDAHDTAAKDPTTVDTEPISIPGPAAMDILQPGKPRHARDV